MTVVCGNASVWLCERRAAVTITGFNVASTAEGAVLCAAAPYAVDMSMASEHKRVGALETFREILGMRINQNKERRTSFPAGATEQKTHNDAVASMPVFHLSWPVSGLPGEVAFPSHANGTVVLNATCIACTMRLSTVAGAACACPDRTRISRLTARRNRHASTKTPPV